MAIKGYFLRDTRGTHLDRGIIIDDSSRVKVGFAYDNETVYLRFNEDDGHPLSEKFYKRFESSKIIELDISAGEFSKLVKRLGKAQTKLMHAATNFFKSNPEIKPIREYPPEGEKRAKKIKKLERDINTQFDRFLQEYASNLVGKI